MEKPIRRSYKKSNQDNSNFLVIYTLFLVIIAIFVAIYYKKLKTICFGYLLRNLKFKNLYINLLDDPLEITEETNNNDKKNFIISYSICVYTKYKLSYIKYSQY